MSSNNFRYIAYCRKSTDESNKQIQSLETQRRLLTDFIKENKLDCPYFFQEARSAMEENNRVEFSKMVELISNGNADALLVVHLDRLSRNRVETGRLIQLFQKGKLKEIRTPYRQYNTPYDLFFMDFEFMFSAQYSDRLSMRVKEGNQSKILKGEFPGVAKIGYLNRDHKIVPDSLTAPFITYAFEIFSQGGVSLRLLSETLYDRGLRTRNGKKLHVSGVERVLKAPFYVGKFYFNGVLYKGSHTPLVSEELFEKVQELFKNRSKPRPSLHFDTFPYRGYLKCDICGCAITATRKKKHNYYFCTNRRNRCDQHKTYMREEYIDIVVNKCFDHITFDKDMAEKSLEIYVSKLQNEVSVTEENEKKIKNQVSLLVEKKETLVDLLLNKNIDKKMYESRATKVDAEIKELERGLVRKNIENVEAVRDYVGTIKNTGISIKEMLECGDTEVRKDLLNSLCWNLSIRDGDIASVQYKMPWKLFENVSKSKEIDKWLGDRDSNPNRRDQNPQSYR
ncbi:MAG: Recombinase [Candidatus Collierbacteria bacterium GW2011_GWE2_42_48]|nr:MAG: Recombinase [Candidatus Collierbacteria bacterium GW2011_GWE2_42_48]